MSDNQTVNVGFGKIVLQNATQSITAYRLKPPFMRDSAVNTGRRSPGTLITTPVSQFPAVNGNLYSDHVMHPNGTILMFQTSRTRGARRLADGCVLVKLREHGALLHISVNLPTGRESLIGDTHIIFRGRGDLLSPDEAKLYGIELSRNFVQGFFDEDEINELYRVVELQPEIAAKPEVALVATGQGVEVREVAAAPKRRLTFRKGA